MIAGSVAIAVNPWCVMPVAGRKAAADHNDEVGLDAQSRRIYLAFAVGVPCGLMALVSGIVLSR